MKCRDLFVAITLAATAFGAASIAKAGQLSGAALEQYLSGKTITFEDGNKATYNADGKYRYNNAYPGKWYVRGGRVCVTFLAGGSRCDRYFEENGRYYLQNASGRRFNVR